MKQLQESPISKTVKVIALATSIAACLVSPHQASADPAPNELNFTTNLIVSRQVFVAPTIPIVAGVTVLPNGALATASSAYVVGGTSTTSIWSNETPDPSFGVTADTLLDNVSPITGARSNTLDVTTATAGATQISNSFPSKSELSLNFTPNGQGITFMSYVAAPGVLDVSNANTSQAVDPTNLVASVGNVSRAIGQVSLTNGMVTPTSSVLVKPVNSYSGNNGRAAILGSDNNYYMAGNAGNSGSGTTGATLSSLSDNTGIQTIALGSSGNTTAVGAVNGTSGSSTGYQRGYSIAQYGFAADKTGKDDNFRGLTVDPYNGTLYTSKGSGSNGINGVYQIGSGGLPTSSIGNTNITLLNGWTAVSAKTGLTAGTGAAAAPVLSPFGLWFAAPNVLYVGDEGSAGIAGGASVSAFAGLQKWVNSAPNGSGTWSLQYVIQNGLNLGTAYASVPNGPGGEVYPSGLTPANQGLRNIMGVNNPDGTVTIYGVTSTTSANTDQGADPNELVAITDSPTALTLPGNEAFNVVEQAAYGEVIRGVAAVPEPATPVLIIGSLGLLGILRRRNS